MKQVRQQLEEEGEPFYRPDDFFAEMLKTDAHMQKVRCTAGTEALPTAYDFQCHSDFLPLLVVVRSKIN